MGTSKSPAELAAKFDRAAGKVVGSNKSNVEALALGIKTAVLAKARPATGGDLKLSGTGNKSVGVNYRVTGGPVAEAKVKATGPMHWLEGGVKPHAVAPKGLGGSRALRGAFIGGAFSSTTKLEFGKSGVKPLHFANGKFAMYARKAGRFPELRVWSEGVDKVEGQQAEIVRRNTMRELVSVFG